MVAGPTVLFSGGSGFYLVTRGFRISPTTACSGPTVLFLPIMPKSSRVLRGFQSFLSCEARFLQRLEIVQGPAVGRLGHQERGGSLKDCDTMGVDRGPY
jgi:hypothetical protein